MAGDRINDMFCTNITSDADYDAVLACQDRFIRVIQVHNRLINKNINNALKNYRMQGSDLLYDIRVDSAVTTVDRPPQDNKLGKFNVNKYEQISL